MRLVQLREKSLELVNECKAILEKRGKRMTIRQLYYQLVSRLRILPGKKSYQSLVNHLVQARRQWIIHPVWITDRTRGISKPDSFSNLEDFKEYIKDAYIKSKWDNQKHYIEVWVEKDALSDDFLNVTSKYDVPLVVLRGYTSISAMFEASERIKKLPQYKVGKVTILYFGDFDPSGENMLENMKDYLDHFECSLPIKKIALTKSQIRKYNLPTMQTKKKDSRSKGFIKLHGDSCVELDALDASVLEELIEDSIKEYIDPTPWKNCLKEEKTEQKKVAEWVSELKTKKMRGTK